MRFVLDGLPVYFPYEYIYPEQFQYMLELKRALDAKGHCLLEMPTGTGKTITLLSLITSYQAAHPDVGKLIYCTRTVPEMEKVLAELADLVAYRARYFEGSGPGGAPPPILAVGLSSRKNLCINPAVVGAAPSRESADARCRALTASWVRDRAGPAALAQAATRACGGGGCEGGGPSASTDVEDAASTAPRLCPWHEGLEAAGPAAALDPGVYTLADLRALGRKKGHCPYFSARRAIAAASVVVFNYQYMIDPKVASLVSRDLERECVVVFDEAHNIDTVCIDALSVALRDGTLAAADRNVRRLKAAVERTKETDAARLRAEYDRLVAGLRGAAGGGAAPAGGGEEWLANPALPADVLAEAVPGNIRRAEHFVAFLRRLVAHLADRLATPDVETQSPTAFVATLQQALGVDGKTLRFCYDRLASLLKTLEITATDDFAPLHAVADFATLVGTYARGFTVIIEPHDDRAPGVPDPVLQLACLDASLAMRPIFNRFRSVVITSGTLSPLDLYPRILDFRPAAIASLAMTLTRECMLPAVLARSADGGPLSTKFDMRDDPAVVRGYGRLLVDLAAAVPDGLVAFFVSYAYMDAAVAAWHEAGILAELLARKLVFVETADVVETSLALDNFRRACDCGRGAVFLSVARGKVAEGIDFDRHYGRCVVMVGVPYQYTLSRVLRARLDFLRDTFQVRESDYLAFDAVRQAAQCVGRVIRSKADYGLMVFADARYQRADKRDKLPKWIAGRLKDAHLNLSTDALAHVARGFMREMAQPLPPGAAAAGLLSEAQANAMGAAG